jgi:phosphohistidine phosphatase
MLCYFVRHGTAVDAADFQGPDFDRPLTAKGRDRMERVAERLAELGVAVDEIVTSPLLRAKQTAMIIAGALGTRPSEDERLGGIFNAGALKSILHERAGTNALMLVGHEPTMSATIGRVLGGGSVEFKKGAIACVEITETQLPSGTLLWMVPPKLLC